MSNHALNSARVDVWPLKEISWKAGEDDEAKPVKIIMQTLNGPCSFIALCNILILRGDIEILPHDRREVAYEFLSSLVGDYLLKASPDVDITAALSILPITQNGLDLNPLFTGASTFRPTGEGAALELFKQAHIQLVHGWLCDPDSHEYNSLLQTQDYDSSMDLIVEADSLTNGQLVAASEWPGEQIATQPIANTKLSPEEQAKVENAIAVRRFLDTTQSQLTYYGLFHLSSTLKPGDLVALFRNSHLGVLYKPYGEESGLYTLVTDHTFTREESVVWEKLDDIEGSSQFVDALFKDSVPVGGDYAGETAETVARAFDEQAAAEAQSDDLILARQLQAEEDEHARHYYEERQRRADEERRRQESPRNGQAPPPVLMPTFDQESRSSVSLKKQKKKKGDCTIM